MDQKSTATLLELAAKSLLSNEPAAIHALEELPRDLFVPLFGAAFLGGHMNVLKEMVRVWPFRCLHIGTLIREESYYEILEAMIDGLQILPAQNSSPRGPKLRILDLRQDLECETTCSEFRKTTPFCPESCVYSQHSIFKIKEAQNNARSLGIVNSESESQSAWEPMELLVDISISGTLRKNQFLSFLRRKVEQSFGSLHLCCRGLQIDNMSSDRSILRFVDMGCTDNLEVKKADLSEVTTLFYEMIHLTSLSLFNIPFKSCKGRNFKNFLTWLGRLDNLQDISLSFFYLKNQLQKLLRVLPPALDTLYLSYCGLSNRDVTALSQSPQATHLTMLILSNNEIFSEAYEPFQTLLENVSGTLQHLQVNNCRITDSALSAVLPALSHCSHLRVLSFAHNPITMPMLMSLLQQLTSLMELKHVIYPVPVHCYEQEDSHSRLDRQKLAEVQAQLMMMLQKVQRDDMNWTTSHE
ncbi:melanoma antigen preferentially expressed in tumors-like [Pteropus alecto]|uniref:Leucine-rich repeat-containing protein 14 n=1 Tax=Pteropus alecto TaxID=9402 RepID=L5L577_PTEAL|nr:melanoma antigen preferentially expressed in tumors-like [Pteropus alecto]ELK18797.1 Leucine-rich repeat-containing protein PRAME-like protein [Pteropus alecto]